MKELSFFSLIQNEEQFKIFMEQLADFHNLRYTSITNCKIARMAVNFSLS